jgi:hypothetical protein
MICDKVGRNEWKNLNVGETGIFTLPNEKAVESARIAAQDVKRLEHYEFERIKTYDPLTIAFRRLK